ncbi:hypothetical protein GK047_01085 [Paenibacillus sp. SYP-B3998]|uniref:Uncharacterized protein n=1 Tax=Paenibacillus sp. SYP-B3998 TaxID=2678564 RepID=A0A6G3ZRF6_9BACL|nr:hypothetical protein [Paenibacillus sp. SYP-B3998]NEW04618.1 hypothetical protein [Paenibacillus sp. SYP-B3998]
MFEKILNKKILSARISEFKEELVLELEDGVEINVQIVMPVKGQFELEVDIE